MENTKLCVHCQESLPLDCFYVHCSLCKHCTCYISSENRRKRARAQFDSVSQEDIDDVNNKASHLYIASYEHILPGVYKIGHSKDPALRMAMLQAGQAFHMNLDAVYPNLGHLENTVHSTYELLNLRKGFRMNGLKLISTP